MKTKTRLYIAIALIAFTVGFTIGWGSVAPQYLPILVVDACMVIFIILMATLILLLVR